MKYLKKGGQNKSQPNVWKVLSLLYEPGMFGDKSLELKPSKLHISKIARACETTNAAVMRIREACETGGREKVLALKWGGGAPCVGKLPKEEIEWLLHPNTLKIQSHMSLDQRAEALNLQFDRDIDGRYVSRIFRGMGISKQRFRSSLGPPAPTVKSLEK